MNRKDDQEHRPDRVWWPLRPRRCEKCGERWVKGRCTRPRTKWGDLPAVEEQPEELTAVITVWDLAVKNWQQEGT